MSKNLTELILSIDAKSINVISLSHGSLLDRSVSPEVIEIYKEAMERDKFTCRYCGFHCEKGQEVNHINHDHSNHLLSNLETVCSLCHQSFHLNSVDINKSAELIWLPEMTQEELNHLCRTLFVAQRYKDNANGKSNNFILNNSISYIYKNLLFERKRTLDRKFNGASNAGVMGQFLFDMKRENLSDYQNRAKFIKNIKLLHNPNNFITQTNYWIEYNFKNIPINEWINFATKSDVAKDTNEFIELNDEPLINY